MTDDTRVCKDCGRRYADAGIIKAGVCPSCGGPLVALHEGPYPDPSRRS